MNPTEVKILAVYAAGVVVFPFVCSLVDGWPFASPRQNPEDMLCQILAVVLWPVLAVGWLVSVWWCASSWLGVRLREAVVGLFRRGRSK